MSSPWDKGPIGVIYLPGPVWRVKPSPTYRTIPAAVSLRDRTLRVVPVAGGHAMTSPWDKGPGPSNQPQAVWIVSIPPMPPEPRAIPISGSFKASYGRIVPVTGVVA